MAYPYTFTAEAQKEYEDSVYWYLERSKKVAAGFVEAINRTLELICEHPYRWQNPFGHFYELQVRKYPFSIIYSVQNEERVVIIAVFHHKRNPARKYRVL